MCVCHLVLRAFAVLLLAGAQFSDAQSCNTDYCSWGSCCAGKYCYEGSTPDSWCDAHTTTHHTAPAPVPIADIGADIFAAVRAPAGRPSLPEQREPAATATTSRARAPCAMSRGFSA